MDALRIVSVSFCLVFMVFVLLQETARSVCTEIDSIRKGDSARGKKARKYVLQIAPLIEIGSIIIINIIFNVSYTVGTVIFYGIFFVLFTLTLYAIRLFGIFFLKLKMQQNP